MKNMLETLRSYAEAGKYKRVPVSRELYADAFTPVEVMRTLRAASRHCYLLESAEDKQRWGRYSFLGYAPTMEITCTDGHVTITEGAEEEEKNRREFDTDHPGEVLREILKDYKSPVMEGMPPFTGGLVGYFSYEYIKYAELSDIWILREISTPVFRSGWLIRKTDVSVYSPEPGSWRTVFRRMNLMSAGIRPAQ